MLKNIFLVAGFAVKHGRNKGDCRFWRVWMAGDVGVGVCV